MLNGFVIKAVVVTVNAPVEDIKLAVDIDTVVGAVLAVVVTVEDMADDVTLQDTSDVGVFFWAVMIVDVTVAGIMVDGNSSEDVTDTDVVIGTVVVVDVTDEDITADNIGAEVVTADLVVIWAVLTSEPRTNSSMDSATSVSISGKKEKSSSRWIVTVSALDSSD